jgi:large subunit ribosomal protein L35Ae
MSQPIYGRIVNYRIGIRTQASRECPIQFSNIISSAQAGQLVGKRVVWKGKEDFVGRIVGFHGKNGAVRVRFRKGVPGQALGAIVEVVN